MQEVASGLFQHRVGMRQQFGVEHLPVFPLEGRQPAIELQQQSRIAPAREERDGFPGCALPFLARELAQSLEIYPRLRP